MKKILLIDGENFVHSIVHSLRRSKLIHSRTQLERFDCQELFAHITAGSHCADVAYYTTKVQVRSAPASLVESLNDIRAWNAKWVPYLANQHITFIKAGNLKVRDSKRCSTCGHKTSVLQEKGVDVRLAVDIVARAGRGVELYILSSDVDLMSAVVAAKNRGATVAYVAFEGTRNYALAKAADKVIEVKHSVVAQAFNKVNP
jgi:uncharacterized LabA/DUF88 family protein